MNQQAIEAEMSVIGSCLLGATAEVATILEERHFGRPAHKLMYACLLDLMDEGKPDDASLFLARLAAKDLLEVVGGQEYIISVCEFVHSPKNAKFYAEAVREFWFRREIGKLGKLAETWEVPILQESAEHLFREMALGINAPIGRRLGTIGTGKPRIGVPTGFEGIDSQTTWGGLAKGQQTCVSAYQKGGKTSFMVSLALNIAKGGRVVFATFADLDGEGLEERALRQMSGWGFQPSGPDAIDYHEARTQLREELNIEVYDPLKDRAPKDLESFHSWLRMEHRKEPIVCVIADYAQKLRSKTVPVHDFYTQGHVCAEMVDDMARELFIPYVIGSQVTPGTNGGVEITKGNRVWEENTSLLLRLRRFTDEERAKVDEEYRGINNLSAIDLVWQRFGPSDQRIWSIWNERKVRFEEL